MKHLNPQQIKQEQLKLLLIDGISLAQYATPDDDYKILVDLQKAKNLPELSRLNVSKLKSAGLSCNANLNALGYAVLYSIYRGLLKEDLLNFIKSCLYSSEIDLTSIKHSPASELSNINMKKILVQFMYSLSYSEYQNKVEAKLNKFPIVMNIFVLFMRAMLVNLNVKNADDYLSKVPTIEAYNALIDFLDMNCRSQNSLFLFYQDRIFIVETECEEIMMGIYVQNQIQSNLVNIKNSLPLSELHQQIEEDTQKSMQSMHSSHNRSLELKGAVSESVVFTEQEASTPFFKFQNQSNSSFSNSMEVNASENDLMSRKQGLFQSSKEMSPLKMLDSKTIKRSDLFGNGSSLKRTMYQNDIKREMDLKETLDRINSSPIPENSPHNLIFDATFKPQAQQVSLQTKTMKRSKSEHKMKVLNDVEQDKQKNREGKKLKKKKGECECNNEKKTKFKLASNLYEINMSYVPNQGNFYKKYPNEQDLNSSQGDLYISSKGISSEMYLKIPDKNPPWEKVSPKCIGNSIIATNGYLDKISSSCSLLPQRIFTATNFNRAKTENEVIFSDRSNNGEEGQRSYSPYSRTASGYLPKITFSYGNTPKNATDSSSHKINQKKIH